MKPHIKIDQSLFRFLNININNNLKLQYTMWDAYVTKSKMMTSHERFIRKKSKSNLAILFRKVYIYTPTCDVDTVLKPEKQRMKLLKKFHLKRYHMAFAT